MLLDIVLNSLEDPVHVAAVLGYNNGLDRYESKDLCNAEALMTVLLHTFNVYTVSF